ncbi:SagB family peptide dehydrogenase [Actinomadura barringtoniae]|uniref:SagB family peptide dehydrogenase n=1 Tax=Actinomadura barringtoniae TaxID=1427535 RepID=A0A939P6P1_9ACTN|nr:SagB family peptide dehydrogenase [Actinomadura barringtoniae]MBO2446295.1 SagB family peptide dehydrogenase [Actinomadura barringtoniae]
MSDPETWTDPFQRAILANSLISVDRAFESTGFRTAATRYRAGTTSAQDQLADLFLLNTGIERHDHEAQASVRGYFIDSGLTMLSHNGREAIDAVVRVPLPDPSPLDASLADCLRRRRSRRRFSGGSVGRADLSALLWAAAGITARARVEVPGSDDTVEMLWRTAPSPGGLYGVDLHVAAANVEGLERGLYRFDPRGGALWLVDGEAAMERALEACCFSEEMISVSQAGAALFLCGRPPKLYRKYGDRGLRYLFLEAGEIVQNVHLAVTALGLGDVETAGFYDQEVNEALGLDGLTATLVHTVVVGVLEEHRDRTE